MFSLDVTQWFPGKGYLLRIIIRCVNGKVKNCVQFTFQTDRYVAAAALARMYRRVLARIQRRLRKRKGHPNHLAGRNHALKQPQQRAPLTTPHSFQVPLRNEAPKRFSSTHIVSHNYSNFFFGHSFAGLAHQILDLSRNSEQPQFKANVGYKALKGFS